MYIVYRYLRALFEVGEANGAQAVAVGRHQRGREVGGGARLQRGKNRGCKRKVGCAFSDTRVFKNTRGAARYDAVPDCEWLVSWFAGVRCLMMLVSWGAAPAEQTQKCAQC